MKKKKQEPLGSTPGNDAFADEMLNQYRNYLKTGMVSYRDVKAEATTEAPRPGMATTTDGWAKSGGLTDGLVDYAEPMEYKWDWNMGSYRINLYNNAGAKVQAGDVNGFDGPVKPTKVLEQEEYDRLVANQKPQDWDENQVLVNIEALTRSLVARELAFRGLRTEEGSDDYLDVWDSVYDTIFKHKI